MSGMSRREFLRRSVASGVAGGVVLSGAGKVAAGVAGGQQVATVIDLSKCDGCGGREVPECVAACRTANGARFPEPEGPIHDYWPQKKHEDWSQKRHLTNRLTPYNWLFVQRVDVSHEGKTSTVFVPRRCMHCDNPPCANLCPFSAQEKTPEGPVLIDPNICFGGAKCRDVCPWSIPQRQAGVGLYMKVAPRYLGGGVMYKCDLCYDRITKGQLPACVEACPRQALSFGSREEMQQLAASRAKEIQGFIYGDRENGGTSTWYVSPVPFTAIHQALQAKDMKPGMPVAVDNYMDSFEGMAKGLLLAPFAGAVAAGVAAYRTLRKGE